MQISEAGKLIEVHGAETANKRLAEGWSLLAMFPAENKNGGATYGVYVLGMAKAKPDPMEGFKLGAHATQP